MSAFLKELEAGATPSIAAFVDALAPAIPALAEFADTPQDPGWHAEGDVFIHTGMVLDEVYELLATRAAHLVGPRRTALVLGAALHDVAKPFTTRTMTIQGVERVAAPRHEMIGRSYLVPRLLGLGLPWAIVEPVLDLVGYHVTPKFLVVKNRERGSYQRLARSADPELLYWLELADMLGRRCVDRDQQVEHIEMFGLFAREYAAWRRFGDDAPDWRGLYREQLRGLSPATRDVCYGSFVHDLEAGRVTHPHEGLARSYRFRDEPFPEVVVTVGPSGSGKSTWIERNLGDHDVVSLDAIRDELGSRADQSQNGKVRQIAKDRLKDGLRAKAKLVWDATNLRRDFRDAVTNLARDYGALVTMVCFPRSAAQYAARNHGREHAVPANVLRRQLDAMQWPEVPEAHRWLVIGPSDEVLAYYGGLDDELPYGLRASEQTLREAP
ncbi:MAG: AAA family ATPase [Myxococcales bacterium]|nr:AAA family ATPase [Myxococcales bacterium]